MDAPSEPPPRGFVIIAADESGFTIRYRTSGMGCVALFFAVWLSGWTASCVLFTAGALFNPDGVIWLLLLFMLPFWVIEFGTITYVAWFFGSQTRFTFGPDELIAERSLWRFRRRRAFRREEITAVRQIKDGGEGEDSFPSWALAVIGQTEVRLISRQPIDKSNWLGPIIARWAGVAFEPCEPAKARKYESL